MGATGHFILVPTLESDWDLLLRYLRFNRIIKTFLYDFLCMYTSSSKCKGQGLAQGWTAEDFVYAAERRKQASSRITRNNFRQVIAQPADWHKRKLLAGSDGKLDLFSPGSAPKIFIQLKLIFGWRRRWIFVMRGNRNLWK